MQRPSLEDIQDMPPDEMLRYADLSKTPDHEEGARWAEAAWDVMYANPVLLHGKPDLPIEAACLRAVRGQLANHDRLDVDMWMTMARQALENVDGWENRNIATLAVAAYHITALRRFQGMPANAELRTARMYGRRAEIILHPEHPFRGLWDARATELAKYAGIAEYTDDNYDAAAMIALQGMVLAIKARRDTSTVYGQEIHRWRSFFDNLGLLALAVETKLKLDHLPFARAAIEDSLEALLGYPFTDEPT